MIGKRQHQEDLFDVGHVWDIFLSPKSFHGQLARAANRLFRDEDFAGCYDKKRGRPSVPPSQLALLTLLQHHAGVSDGEAVERSCWDARWAAVLRKQIGEPLCAKSTLQLFRSHLILHDAVLMIFRQSIVEAKRAGLLTGKPLRVALDTKPIIGRGAVEDTYNLLATGIRQLGKALAKALGQNPEAWAGKHDFGRYFVGSIKGSATVDWSDPAAKNEFLTEIVTDARRLLRQTGDLLPRLPSAAQPGVREAAELLEQLLLQDVVETARPGSRPVVELKDGTSPGRIPAALDADGRHGRKSKSNRFVGHKAAVGVDGESQIIVEASVLAGDAADAQDALGQVERAGANTEQAVTEAVGDCAYGGGATREAFAQANIPLVARVPQEGSNGGLFPKSAFVINLEAGTVRCPAGHTASQGHRGPSGEWRIYFGAVCATCPLQPQCTHARRGRQVEIHAQEGLLRAARALQQTPAGRDILRQRVVVEHALARLAHLEIGQARYVGRKKTRFQLLLACTVANLRRTWNWVQATEPGPGEAEDDRSRVFGRSFGSAVRGLRSLAIATGHCLRVWRRARPQPSIWVDRCAA